MVPSFGVNPIEPAVRLELAVLQAFQSGIDDFAQAIDSPVRFVVFVDFSPVEGRFADVFDTLATA